MFMCSFLASRDMGRTKHRIHNLIFCKQITSDHKQNHQILFNLPKEYINSFVCSIIYCLYIFRLFLPLCKVFLNEEDSRQMNIILKCTISMSSKKLRHKKENIMRVLFQRSKEYSYLSRKHNKVRKWVSSYLFVEE